MFLHTSGVLNLNNEGNQGGAYRLEHSGILEEVTHSLAYLTTYNWPRFLEKVEE